MKKLSLRIDVTKINKAKILPREYQNQAGETVKEMNLNVEIIPVKDEKVVKSTDTYTLVKVGFIAEKSTKKEDGTYENGTIIGDAFEYRDVIVKETEQVIPSGYKAETGEANIDDIPF